MINKTGYYFFLIAVMASCQSKEKESEKVNHTTKPENRKTETGVGHRDSISLEYNQAHTLATADLHDSSFIFIKKWSDDFAYDMKYATADNFIGKKVYNCDQCMIRKKVALALMKANRDFMQKGYHIKFFDCYRPLDVQKIMWEVYPVEGYVANPYTSGSIHNRGGAVDITLVDKDENELDMGTSFDHFGKEAHHAYRNLPEQVLNNRKLLKDTMEKHGFKSISTEWWHYNFGEARVFALSNFPTECDQ